MKFIITLLPLLLLASNPAEEEEVKWIDDFESKEMSEWHGRAADFDKIYKINSTENSSYLSASSSGSDNFILKKTKIDITEYPYLNWKWRAKTLPNKGDESQKSTCDIAASVIVVLRASKWRPQSIKYTWSTTLARHTFSKSPYAFWPSRTDIIVMQSGEENVGEWITEKVNVLEHYKTLYEKAKVKSKDIEAFAIMTDSDNTNSLSEADYDDIFFSKN